MLNWNSAKSSPICCGLLFLAVQVLPTPARLLSCSGSWKTHDLLIGSHLCFGR